MNIKNRTATIMRIGLILAALAFIWLNSLDSIPESAAKSAFVLKIITPFLERIVGSGNVTDHLVRKLAHFIEFGVLGVLLAAYAAARKELRLQAVINCMSFSLAVAVVDESIQLFSGRGSRVQDILIDFSGAVLGIALVLLIRGIAMRPLYKRGRDKT